MKNDITNNCGGKKGQRCYISDRVLPTGSPAHTVNSQSNALPNKVHGERHDISEMAQPGKVLSMAA